MCVGGGDTSTFQRRIKQDNFVFYPLLKGIFIFQLKKNKAKVHIYHRWRERRTQRKIDMKRAIKKQLKFYFNPMRGTRIWGGGGGGRGKKGRGFYKEVGKGGIMSETKKKRGKQEGE